MKITVAVLFVILLISSCVRTNPNGIDSWLYQLQNIDPSEISSTGFDLVVIDYSSTGGEDGEFNRDQIELIKNTGKTVLAYLSIGEAEDYRFYWKEEWYENPPEWLGRENPEWEGNYAVKYWEDGWKEIINEYVDRIMDQGFDGLYLDKVDEFEYWADPENGEELHIEESTAASYMIDFISQIRDWVGDEKILVIQNGERIVDYDDGTLMNAINGLAVESLFSDPEFQERKYHVNRFQEEDKFILSVEYIVDQTDPSSLTRVESYVNTARELGYIPYAADEDMQLDEIILIEGIQP